MRGLIVGRMGDKLDLVGLGGWRGEMVGRQIDYWMSWRWLAKLGREWT